MFHRKIDTKYKLLKCCHVNGGSKPPPYDLIDKRKFESFMPQKPWCACKHTTVFYLRFARGSDRSCSSKRSDKMLLDSR